MTTFQKIEYYAECKNILPGHIRNLIDYCILELQEEIKKREHRDGNKA